MREITDGVLGECSSELEQKYWVYDPVLETSVLEYPFEAFNERDFEVDDFGDLHRNYLFLSQTTVPWSLPGGLWRPDYPSRKYLSDPVYQDLAWCELNECLQYNPCFVFLEHLTLSNFHFIQRSHFKAVEFDLTDIQGRTLRGVFDYWHKPEELDDREKQQELQAALHSGADLFGVEAQAMDARYLCRDGHLRGRRLYVHTIYKDPSGSAEIPVLPVEKITLPVLA